MAKKSQLIEFYEQVLATGNLEPDDDGFINGYSLGKAEPVPMTMGIKRNRLAIPLPSILRNTQDIAIFHPLQENVLEGLTPVMKKLIATYEVIFNMKIMAMVTALAKFGTDMELQNKLTGREGIKNLLAKLVRLSIRKQATPVSDTNYENIVSKLEQVTKENVCSFITLNVRRAGTAEGKKWARAGVVQFPFYNTLVEEEAKEKSSLGTKKEIRILIAILEYIFKDIANPSMYCGGSNDNSAPSLMALLATMYKLANDFNGVIDDVNGIIDISILRIPTEWEGDLENGEKFTSEARRIPSTPENRGAVNKKDQMVNSTAINMQAVEEKLAESQPVPRELEEQPAPQPQAAPVAPVIPQQTLVPPMTPPVMQPQAYQAPAPQQSKEDGISVNDLLGFQPQPVAPVYQQMHPQMMQQPMMYPGQPVMYPQQQWGYPQPQLPQQIGGTPVLW